MKRVREYSNDFKKVIHICEKLGGDFTLNKKAKDRHSDQLMFPVQGKVLKILIMKYLLGGLLN